MCMFQFSIFNFDVIYYYFDAESNNTLGWPM